MKNFKKRFMALISGILLIMSLSVSAFAADNENDASGISPMYLESATTTWRQFDYQNQGHFSYEPTRAIQILLADSCLYCGDDIFNSGGIDGSFGPTTAECVRCFQRRQNLSADGSVGPDTWGAFPRELNHDPIGPTQTNAGILHLYQGNGYLYRHTKAKRIIGQGSWGGNSIWFHNSGYSNYVEFGRY